MKTRLLLALCTLGLGVQLGHAQSTAFNYQGHLTDASLPPTGSYSMGFQLYNAATGGSPVSFFITFPGVAVTAGDFAVTLDFGSAPYNGQTLWLQVTAGPASGTPSPVILAPRQELPPVPYAIIAGSAATLTPSATLSGVPTFGATGGPPFVVNTTTKVNNLNADLLDGFDSSWFWQLGGNVGTTPGVNFLGTTDNKALEVKVNNTRALRIEPGTTANIIGGYSGNSVAPGMVGAFIGSGGSAGFPNTVKNGYGAIAGGLGNTIWLNDSFIGGGIGNSVSGDRSVISGGRDNNIQTNTSNSAIGGGRNNIIQAGARGAQIGGGEFNIASTNHATVAGGTNNQALANYAAIGGGKGNVVIGDSGTVAGGERNVAGNWGTVVGGVANQAGYSATVVGGRLNYASGDSSVAMGNLAQALHTASFVFSDGQGTAFASTAANQFSIRAAGGVRLDDSTSMSFGATTRQMLSLYNADFGLGVQNYTLYSRVGLGDGYAWFQGGVHTNNQNDPGAGGTTLMTLDANANLAFNGGLIVDADNNGDGSLGSGIKLGWSGSGEGIASRRIAGVNQNGLDFYTAFTSRLSIANGGNIGINTSVPTARLDVNGDTRVQGLFRSGSETGTSQPPNLTNGMVVRRINSNNSALNQVIARNDKVTLERDGSTGGLLIRYTGAVRQTIACMGITSSGAVANFFLTITPAGAGTTQVYTDAQNVVYVRCNFGDPYAFGHQTDVVLLRQSGDTWWTGTVTSTFNQ